jgi:hypothetical protein
VRDLAAALGVLATAVAVALLARAVLRSGSHHKTSRSVATAPTVRPLVDSSRTAFRLNSSVQPHWRGSSIVLSTSPGEAHNKDAPAW